MDQGLIPTDDMDGRGENEQVIVVFTYFYEHTYL